MKKIYILISLLALAACTDQIVPDNEMPEDKWTLIVSATKDAESTKALTENGTSLLATFSAGDKIYVYKPTTPVADFIAITSSTLIGELTAQSDGVSTTFSGEVSNANFAVDGQLLLAFRGTSRNYTGQDGTLETIATKCDYAYASTTIRELDGENKLIKTDLASFVNQQAICKLSFIDQDNQPLTVKKLKVGGFGGNNLYERGVNFLGYLEFSLATPADYAYVALHNIHQGEKESYTFTVWDNDDVEWLCKKKAILRDGKYYATTLKMTKKSEWVEPYVTTIANLNDLMDFVDHVNSGNQYSNITVTMTADIDMQGVAFTSIGNKSYAFSGTFDGGGHTISNLVINEPTTDYVGFFRGLTADTKVAATVKDLHFVNCSITGKNNVGAIAAHCYANQNAINATISGCTVSGSVTGNDNVGGLVGTLGCQNILNCTNSASVTGHNYVGGIAGWSKTGKGTFTNCTNQGEIIATGYCVGGIFGFLISGNDNENTVNNAVNEGNITVSGGANTYNVGGIVGQLSKGKISDSINKGNITPSVSGSVNIGGLVGHMYNAEGDNIINCINTGELNATERIGGIVGKTTKAKLHSISGCLNIGKVAVDGSSTIIGAICGVEADPADETFNECYFATSSVCVYAVNGGSKNGTAPVYSLTTAAGATISGWTTPKATYNGVPYYLSGATVTFTGGATGYTASNGVLTSNDTEYTLTMPASDVTISAN